MMIHEKGIENAGGIRFDFLCRELGSEHLRAFNPDHYYGIKVYTFQYRLGTGI